MDQRREVRIISICSLIFLVINILIIIYNKW